MTGAAAISSSSIALESNGRIRASVSLKALGVLGVYVSDLEARSVEGDFMVMIFGKPVPVGCVRKSGESEKVLEVDVEGAWREMGERAGWSNEVAVEVFVG